MVSFAPVTLTFPGATVAFARAGNIVTAAITPTGGALDQLTRLPIPDGMAPTGNVGEYLLSATSLSTGYALRLDEYGALGAIGVSLVPLGSAPYVPFTVQWLADPVPDGSASNDHDLDEFFVHTASVETWQGRGSLGDVFAAPVTVSCFIDDTRRLVRDGQGEQVVSEATLYTSILNAGLFVQNSRVTILGDNDADEITPSRSARVIRQNANDSGNLGLPDHLAVTLA